MLAVTADGYELSLTSDGLKRIAARLDGSGLRPLVKRFYDGDLRRAVRRAVRRLAGNSHRTGSLRNVETGRRSVVFGTHSAGTTYNLVTRPVSLDRFEIVSVNATEDVEFSDSIYHREFQNEIIKELMRRGLRLPATDAQAKAPGYIRDNRYQMRSDGTVIEDNIDVPDVSYIDQYGRRVNIEIDTREKVSPKERKRGKRGHREHLRTLIKNDPNAMHIGIVIDPETGNILSRRVYAPQGQGYKGDYPKPIALPGHPEAPTADLPPPMVPTGLPSQPPPRLLGGPASNVFNVRFRPQAGMQPLGRKRTPPRVEPVKPVDTLPTRGAPSHPTGHKPAGGVNLQPRNPARPQQQPQPPTPRGWWPNWRIW